MPKTAQEIASLPVNDLVKEINFLAHEQKVRVLTIEEMAYQKMLRERYIGLYRQNFKDNMRTITVVDEAGNDVTPEKLKAEKAVNK
jgi:uncharacterized protein YnzC (UPF0291/DUF896 family)